jgi:hypothetical protein
MADELATIANPPRPVHQRRLHHAIAAPCSFQRPYTSTIPSFLRGTVRSRLPVAAA